MGLRLGTLCATSENTGPSARHTPNWLDLIDSQVL